MQNQTDHIYVPPGVLQYTTWCDQYAFFPRRAFTIHNEYAYAYHCFDVLQYTMYDIITYYVFIICTVHV